MLLVSTRISSIRASLFRAAELGVYLDILLLACLAEYFSGFSPISVNFLLRITTIAYVGNFRRYCIKSGGVISVPTQCQTALSHIWVFDARQCK
jgi:hypothetical protein